MGEPVRVARSAVFLVSQTGTSVTSQRHQYIIYLHTQQPRLRQIGLWSTYIMPTSKRQCARTIGETRCQRRGVAHDPHAGRQHVRRRCDRLRRLLASHPPAEAVAILEFHNQNRRSQQMHRGISVQTGTAAQRKRFAHRWMASGSTTHTGGTCSALSTIRIGISARRQISANPEF
jgi:hypothetical protein